MEDCYLISSTFVHCLHLYIAQFVCAGSTLNMAALNLTYLLQTAWMSQFQWSLHIQQNIQLQCPLSL